MANKQIKTVRVVRKKKTGTHTYQPSGDDGAENLVIIKGGESWDCPEKLVANLDPALWDLPSEVEKELGGPSRRKPPKPKVGLTKIASETAGMWDVVNETSLDPINDEPLTEEEADALVEESTKGA